MGGFLALAIEWIPMFLSFNTDAAAIIDVMIIILSPTNNPQPVC